MCKSFQYNNNNITEFLVGRFDHPEGSINNFRGHFGVLFVVVCRVVCFSPPPSPSFAISVGDFLLFFL